MNDQASPAVEPAPTAQVCSFCDKPVTAVNLLLAGHDAHICDACVRTSMAVVAAKSGGRQFRLTHGLLQDHFAGLPPESIAASSRVFPRRMRADLQRALQSICLHRAAKTVGIHCTYQHESLRFSVLLEQGSDPKSIAPLQYEDVDIGEAEPVRCLVNALVLAVADAMPVAVLVAHQFDYGEGAGINVEVAVPLGEDGAAFTRRFFNDLEHAVHAAQSYRGKVLSLEARRRFSGMSTGILVHKLRHVAREAVILPPATLDLLDQNIVQFACVRDQLRALGMSAKKGLLFYGPPGTGKTHTVHYLASSLPDHTTLLVTAEQVGLLSEYFQLARLLQPTIMVIEDADLIARDRQTMGSACEEVLLNQLLNEMDGLREDAEIFFILTTNRPETLEAALAARPGRIDQAVEFPLPDAHCRRQLVRLYAANLQVSEQVSDTIVKRTEGVSASFIKELMRRAAQYAIRAGAGNGVTPDHIEAALGEMLFTGGVLNASLLGGAKTSEAFSGST